ncbi:hypothetical protein BD408DRAFT_416412 [Parasitella parasitica]|nr:hypothetical protein BD408DRAFT_416412 [Parasitella parasitica]
MDPMTYLRFRVPKAESSIKGNLNYLVMRPLIVVTFFVQYTTIFLSTFGNDGERENSLHLFGCFRAAAQETVARKQNPVACNGFESSICLR